MAGSVYDTWSESNAPASTSIALLRHLYAPRVRGLHQGTAHRFSGGKPCKQSRLGIGP